jgi:hypothetical protein
MSVPGIPDYVPNHADRACDKLTSMFRGRMRIEGMLRSFANRSQKIEDTERRLLSAFANWSDVTHPDFLSFILDLIGKVVGEPRDGRTDSKYIPALKIRIMINRSDGTDPTIDAILDALGGTYEETDWYPACFIVTVYDPSHFLAFAGAMRDAKPIGVQMVLGYHDEPENVVRHDSTYGVPADAEYPPCGYSTSYVGGGPSDAHVEIV